IPGTLPMRLTTIRSRLFPVRTLTALPIVMFSKLTLFTSVILSPTHSPACSVVQQVSFPHAKYIICHGDTVRASSFQAGFADSGAPSGKH
uniref:Uncharacterized protein n=1 Tax=Podarcis muralis TaxID=64176 RepID=A0A670I3D8_PODMU